MIVALDRHGVAIVLAGALISLAALMPGCSGSDAPDGSPGSDGPDMEAKATCLSLEEGKKPKRIWQWKYDVLREAIEEVISSSNVSPVPVDTLDEAVVDQLTLQGQAIDEIGTNLEWFTNLVLDDMEVRGLVERVVKNDAEFVTLK